MNLFSKLLIFALISALLVGCNLDVPTIKTASYSTFHKGSPGESTELTSAQMQQFSAWLAAHRSDWSLSVTSYVPRVYLKATLTDGKYSSFNIWSNQIVVVVDTKQYVRSLTPAENASIMAILQSVK